ncbi:MAG: type VII toxin-antitoxin system HepT family RNase toxin [Bacillota bacterium]
MVSKSRRILHLNHNLIMEKITDIERAMALLDRITLMEKEAFLSDQIVISGAKYQLILAIEAAQNICNHLAARVAKEVPDSYADCFRILAENRILSKSLMVKLASMAKFRNLLVHQYGKVDDSTVYSILKSDVRDIISYVEEIKSFLISAGEEKSRAQRKTPPGGRGENKD